MQILARRAYIDLDDDASDASSVASNADSRSNDDNNGKVTSDASLNSLAFSKKEVAQMDEVDALRQTPNSSLKMNKSFLEEIRDSAKNRAGSPVVIVASKKKSASDSDGWNRAMVDKMLERSKVTSPEEDASSVSSDGWSDDDSDTVTSNASLNSLAVSKKEAAEMDKTDALTQTSARAKNEAHRKSTSMDKDQDTSNDSTTPKP